MSSTNTQHYDWSVTRFGDLTILTGDVPYHLQPDALPLGECNRCSRKTRLESELDTEDRLTQPDGNPCGGRIVNLV
jgi:hypothetical protein